MGDGGDGERANDRLRVLTRAMRLFAEATDDLAQLLEVVARSLTECLGDSCVLFLLTDDGEQLTPVAGHANDPVALDRIRTLMATTPIVLAVHPSARRMLERQSATLIPVVDMDVIRPQTVPAYAAFMDAQAIHSLLIVPIRARGQIVGMLHLTRYRPTSPAFDADDAELGSNLADQAALAIVNARLYVAERKARLAAEESMRSLRTAQARFAHLSEVGLIGIVVGRNDGSVVDLNPYVEKLVGRPREAFVSGAIPWSALTPPEWQAVDALAWEQLRATGVGALREKELLRVDGTRVPVLVGSAEVADGPEIVSFVLDLTERKQAEATVNQLRAERLDDAKFRVVLEAAPDAIIVANAAGRIRFVNGQAERLLGHTRAELQDQPIELVIPELGGPNARTELLARRKDGTEFPVELTVSTLDTPQGPFVVRALRDVTERRRAETALLRAKAAAESANQELEAFSYSVAHDLRAPLRAVNGFARILLDEHAAQLDVDGRAILERVVRSARNMGALVDGLLDLSRLNRMQPKRERVDLSVMVRAALQQALHEDSSRPPTEIVVEDGLLVEADPTLLRAMVDNLVGNAVKFTGRTPAPRIELGRLEEAYYLRDNGAGFDMAFSKMLFTPFHRLHSEHDFAGNGIGLASVERIVARHGGRIWADGVVGAGATFFFTLPDATF